MTKDETWLYAQQSILGSCLIDGKLCGKIIFGLCEDDFQGVNRTVYNVMRDLYTKGQAVDPVTVLHAIGGGSDYKKLIVDLMDITPTTANIDYHISVCKDLSRLAKYHAIGADLQAAESSEEAARIIAESNRLAISHGMQCWTLADAFKDFFGRYGKNRDFIKFFIPQINSQIRAEFGDFCLIGGRPSSGKSAFALECAVYWAAVCGYRVGFYSHETSKQKLTDRITAACAKVPLDHIKDGTLTEKELESVCLVSSKLAEAPIDLLSASGSTVAEMKAKAMERRHQIVIVDYLQIVEGPGDTEYAVVSGVSKSLHIMCQSLGIFCLALCQLSRLRGSRPDLEDLRSSGQLEQDADSVIFLHKKSDDLPVRECITAKNKEGECKTTLLHFDGPIQHFSYLGNGKEPTRGYDYLKMPSVKAPSQELETLPMDTFTPFDRKTEDDVHACDGNH